MKKLIKTAVAANYRLNSIIMKNLMHILIISLICFSLNCYTIIDKYSSSTATNLPYNNHKIVGAWIHKVHEMDSKGEIKRLELFVNGDVLFYPNVAWNNLIYQTGKFNIQNDTLIIKMFNNDFEERFVFTLYDSHLILERINNNHYIKYPIQNGGDVQWEKVTF
jgi:hypothetical protein